MTIEMTYMLGEQEERPLGPTRQRVRQTVVHLGTVRLYVLILTFQLDFWKSLSPLREGVRDLEFVGYIMS